MPNTPKNDQKMKEEFEKQLKMKKFEDQKKKLMEFSVGGYRNNVSADRLIQNILGPETKRNNPSSVSKNIPSSSQAKPIGKLLTIVFCLFNAYFLNFENVFSN